MWCAEDDWNEKMGNDPWNDPSDPELSKIERWAAVFGRIPLLKGEGGPKGRVRGKDLISLPLTRRFAAPSPFRRGIRPGNYHFPGWGCWASPLNWWLKGDVTATGKGLLVGAACPYCSDSAWDVKSAHLP